MHCGYASLCEIHITYGTCTWQSGKRLHAATPLLSDPRSAHEITHCDQNPHDEHTTLTTAVECIANEQMRDISCLVLDEAHHAASGHPYAIIMQVCVVQSSVYAVQSHARCIFVVC